MVKPKGIRKAGIGSHRPSMGYSGIARDVLSMFSVDMNKITETVTINEEKIGVTQTIVQSVIVVVTP